MAIVRSFVLIVLFTLNAVSLSLQHHAMQSPLFRKTPLRGGERSVITMTGTSESSDGQGVQPKTAARNDATEGLPRRSRVSLNFFRLLGAKIPPSKESNFWALERTKFLRQLLAECIGTFILVQLGTGAVMSAIFTDSLVGLFQIATVWVIAVTLAIFCTATVSGAHLNPAISIAIALFRRSNDFGWSKVIPYIIAQTLGAILGAWTNLLMFASTIRKFESANGIIRSSANAIASAEAFGDYYTAPVTTAQAFLAEACGTMVLAFVVFALTHPRNDAMKDNAYIPAFIGVTVGGLIGVVAPLTQAGLNPARDFGPRIVAYAAGWTNVAFQSCWLYIVAPIVGALVGAFLVDKMMYSHDEETST